MSFRDVMANDLASLIGQLPVYCGYSADAQTIPCAWLSQDDSVRFSAIGQLGAEPVSIMVSRSDMPIPPEPDSVLWVSGHRYRVTSVAPIDIVSLRITLDRSDL